MGRETKRLTARTVATLTKPGRHADGGNLYLSISTNGGRRWIFLYRWGGKQLEMGLGSARDVPLARARELADAARAQLAEGANPLEAVIHACQLRLRPILMTSLAFIAGVVPLVFASGAGAEMRHAMGVAVFAGMLGVTLFGLFLTPVFYVVMRSLALRLQRKGPSPKLQLEERVS